MSTALGFFQLALAAVLFLLGIALAVSVWKISRPKVRSNVALLSEAVGSWSDNVHGTIPGLKNHAVASTEGMMLVEGSKSGIDGYISNRRLSDEAIRSVSR